MTTGRINQVTILKKSRLDHPPEARKLRKGISSHFDSPLERRSTQCLIVGIDTGLMQSSINRCVMSLMKLKSIMQRHNFKIGFETCMIIALLSQVFLNISSDSHPAKAKWKATKDIDECRHQIRELRSRGLLLAFRSELDHTVAAHWFRTSVRTRIQTLPKCFLPTGQDESHHSWKPFNGDRAPATSELGGGPVACTLYI